MSIYEQLEGYWTLDEGKSDSGSAKDSTPNDAHGSINGASTTSGIVNEGLRFSNPSDYVSTSSTYTPNTFTISGFVYYSELDTTSDNDYRSIISTNDGSFITLEENREINFQIPNVNAHNTRGGDIPVNTWGHFACTYDGSDKVVYVDGVEAARYNVGAVSPSIDGMTFAPDTSNSNNALIGRLDEIMFHSRALSQSEVQAIATRGNSGVRLPLYKNLVIEFNHRPSAEDNGVIRNETPYSKYNSTNYSVNYGTTGIKTSENVDFSGSGDYIEIPSVGILSENNSDFSIETTIKPDETTNRFVIFETGGDSNGFNYYIDSGTFYFGIWSESNGWDGTWLSQQSGTSWQHFVMTFNSSDNMKLFKNGSKVDSGSPQSNLASHGKDSHLGQQGGSTKYHDGYSSSSYTNHFNGKVGLTRMWDRELSESEAADLNEQTLTKKLRY